MNGRPSPRLLFLAYWFRPTRAAASVRTWNLAKYLRRLGWEVTVVAAETPANAFQEKPGSAREAIRAENLDVIVTRHRFPWVFQSYRHAPAKRLLLGGLRKLLVTLNLEDRLGWAPGAMGACRRFRLGEVDAILATGGPFVTFSLARLLSRRLGCPYVLDYRDLFTANPHTSMMRWPHLVRAERRALEGSSAVAVIASSMGGVLRERFPAVPPPFVVTNGYDPEELAEVGGCPFDHPAVVYAGRFYPPLRKIDPVMAALRMLHRGEVPVDRDDWKLHYFGPHDGMVRAASEEYGVAERVECHGVVSRREALAATKAARISVVISSVADRATPAESGIVTSKVFDSLGLGTPILLVAPPGSNAEGIVGARGRRFTGCETAAIASFLAEAIAGRLPRGEPPAEYAWPNLAAQYDARLRSILDQQETAARTTS